MADFSGITCSNAPIAVAVSGGADSLCLTLLLHQWCVAFSHPFVALTVDHGLRPESPAEAQQVHEWMTDLAIPHKILTWEGEKPTTGLQEKAREARYFLMEKWCLDHNIEILATAHHADDQVETILQRLARGSGLTGLCGISPCILKNFGHVIRPLLSFSKSTLVTTVTQWPHPFITDSSNLNSKFDRVRWRVLTPQLAPLGLAAPSLLRTIHRLRQADQTLEDITTEFLEKTISFCPLGAAYIQPNLWNYGHLDVRHRALKRLLACIGGKPYSPSYESLQRLDDLLVSSLPFPGYTLGGCYFFLRKNTVTVVKETRFACLPQPYLPQMIWDNRFKLDFKLPKNTMLYSLGLKQAQKISSLCQEHPAILMSLPIIQNDSLGLWFMPHFPHLNSCFFPGNIYFTPTHPLTLRQKKGSIQKNIEERPPQNRKNKLK